MKTSSEPSSQPRGHAKCPRPFILPWKGSGSWTRKTSNACRFFRADDQAPHGLTSKTQVKCCVQVVHGTKELTERVASNDLCPCESGKRVKKCCRTAGC